MQQHLEMARKMAKLLDSNFKIMGFRFGYDSLIGLVPIAGDVVGFAFSAYIIWIGYQLHVPASVLLRMIANTTFDFAVGTIPFVGDVHDFFYKASLKNYDLLKKHAGIVNGNVIQGEKV